MRFLLVLLSLLCAAVSAPAYAAPTFYVVDLDTNKVIVSSGPQGSRSIASITKLMTSVVIMDSGLNLDERVTVRRLDGAAGAVYVGRSYTRRELLKMAMVKSDNAAAHALASTYPGGKAAFVLAMNNKARQLKMTNTAYVDASGLAAGNRSTAPDLIKLAVYSERFALIQEASGSSYASLGGRSFGTTNRMLRAGWDIVVAKTGLTRAAGQCYVAIWDEGDHRLAMVILGSSNRWYDSVRLRQRAISLLPH